jgi:hypothetical protein
MPTPTDLVTDLPADFEVFGQAVDTSLADLKGGTTGQVLAKNSGTDMDFIWVAQDDSNAIQNAIVDAKGDLIAASAADTPARLAVGANGTALVADSTAATGLAYSANAPLGGVSSISTGVAMSGASSVTISGISAKSRLWIALAGVSTVNTGVFVGVRFNGDSSAVYGWAGLTVIGSAGTPSFNQSGDQMYCFKTSNNAADTANAMINLSGAFAGGMQQMTVGAQASGTNAESYQFFSAYYAGSAPITSVTVLSSSGNFDAGSFSVWGA